MGIDLASAVIAPRAKRNPAISKHLQGLLKRNRTFLYLHVKARCHILDEMSLADTLADDVKVHRIQGFFGVRDDPLRGQQSGYVLKQLNDYASGVRTSGPNGIMQTIAKRLTPEDIRNLASYLQGIR